MSSSHPRADGPRRRRFTPEQKLAHLAAYEEACEQQQGGDPPEGHDHRRITSRERRTESCSSASVLCAKSGS